MRSFPLSGKEEGEARLPPSQVDRGAGAPPLPEPQADRDALLRRLRAEDVLRVGARAMAPDGGWLSSDVRAETLDGLMRVRGTARTLHITGGG